MSAEDDEDECPDNSSVQPPDVEPDDDAQPTYQVPAEAQRSTSPEAPEQVTTAAASEGSTSPELRTSKFRKNRIVSDDSDSDNDSDSEQNTGIKPLKKQAEKTAVKGLKKERRVAQRKKWSVDELNTLKTLQKADKSLPKGPDMDNLKLQFPFISNRTNAQIKARFDHLQKTGR